VKAAEEADIDALPVEEKHKALLRLCVKLTEHACEVTDEDVEGLRTAGLSEDEILEGVWVACQFNAVDRLADTFGLHELMQLQER
jgi:alkylhydroperoxidase family enzyme